MRWRLRRLAGSPTGEAGHAEGTFDEALFNSPVDLALRPDELVLFVADYENGRIRAILLDDNYVDNGFLLTDVPRWDVPGETLSGRPRNLSIGNNGLDDILRITADNATDGDPSAIIEWNLWGGAAECSLSTMGTLGAIAHDPSGNTATVKMKLSNTGTGWGTLALNGPNRGEITEPPVIPDPPWCDPPTNSVPVEIVKVREDFPIENSGLARINEVVVAFRWLDDGFNFGTGVIAFDPWNEHPTFPGPYTTCGAPTDPASISVSCMDGPNATPYPPWNAIRGPDDPATGLPTAIGAAWRSPSGLLLRAVLDIESAGLQVDYSLVPGLADLPVMSVAYSPSRATYYLSTTNTWGDPGTQIAPNQILALEWVPDAPTYFGGSGRMPIGGVAPVFEQPVAIAADDSGHVVLGTWDKDELIFS